MRHTDEVERLGQRRIGDDVTDAGIDAETAPLCLYSDAIDGHWRQVPGAGPQPQLGELERVAADTAGGIQGIARARQQMQRFGQDLGGLGWAVASGMALFPGLAQYFGLLFAVHDGVILRACAGACWQNDRPWRYCECPTARCPVAVA